MILGGEQDVIRVTSLDKSILAMQYVCQETKASSRLLAEDLLFLQEVL